MSKSLQDQLLKAGLVDTKKAKQAKKEKRKQDKQAFKGQQGVDEAKQLAAQALADKKIRDQLANQQRNEEAQKKAIAAQIKQLIEVNRIDRQGGEIGYQFVENQKIKKIYVKDQQQNQLAMGQLAIVKIADRYELIPRTIAEKIAERDASQILVLNKNDAGVDDDDPYADYKIPDDLMW